MALKQPLISIEFEYTIGGNIPDPEPIYLSNPSGRIPINMTIDGLAGRDVTPGAFQVLVDGRGLPAATFADDSSLLGRTARPGDVIVIYGSGLGPTSTPQFNGALFPVVLSLASQVEVTRAAFRQRCSMADSSGRDFISSTWWFRPCRPVTTSYYFR